MADRERVLFLDVDGVLNNEGVFSDRRFGVAPLDHLCVGRLHDVVRKTGCKIVLSSSWRDVPRLESRLAAADVFSCFVGLMNDRIECRHHDLSTKWLGGDDYLGRGSEIAEWLSRHPEVTTYAIVDDDSDMLPEQMPFFVQTSFDTGLTDEHAERLVAILTATTQP